MNKIVQKEKKLNKCSLNTRKKVRKKKENPLRNGK